MRRSWVQPSLSRDFALLSVAILFILCLISAWVTYTTCVTHTERMAADLDEESLRIEHTLAEEMLGANYLLNALGQQIALDPVRDSFHLAQILKSFDSKRNIFTLLSWIKPDGAIAVSSNKGVLDTPVDVSDRDYVRKALADPWKTEIGKPVEGRVSGHWVIPVVMGLTDSTGRFVGTLMISVDINALTEKISGLVRRNGLSFAIMSKVMEPLAQVSEDKDFVIHNFPMQKLSGINVTGNASGMLSQGSLFWGTGDYTSYRVSQDYPYLILLGYNARDSDVMVRDLLWSRLLQMVVMATFFMMFLWLVRARIIAPVLDMTAVASAVANGEPYTPPPAGGPIEIEALSAQIERVGDYIEESKRISHEMRNKMFMLKKARERAEMDRRSLYEFLASVCREMHTPLNHIVGSAQVMKDQLYGPIENRKYLQYAADIFRTGNILIDDIEGLQTLAMSDTGYISLTERPVAVAGVIDKAVRMVSERLQSSGTDIRAVIQDPPPRLIVDEFRLQQIIMNLLLYALDHSPAGHAIAVEAKTVVENRDRLFFALCIGNAGALPVATELSALAEKLMFTPQAQASLSRTANIDEPADLRLELAKILIELHHGALDIAPSPNGGMTLTLLLPAGRIRLSEEA